MSVEFPGTGRKPDHGGETGSRASGHPAPIRGRIYGLEINCTLPIRSRLAPSQGDPLDYAIRTAETELRPPTGRSPAYRSPYLDSAGRSVLHVYRGEDGDLLRFSESAEFLVSEGRILARPRFQGVDHSVELLLLGSVLVYCLERSSIPALHASSVAVAGGALVFVSGQGAGKSSLACDFLEAGFSLVSDDIVPVQVSPPGQIRVLPSQPSIRLWPSEAGRFLDDWERLPHVTPGCEKRWVPVGPDGFGTFEPQALPPVRIFFPARRLPGDPDHTIEIQPVRPAEAVMEMLRHSFAPTLVEGMGWQERRMEQLAEVAESVPAARLIYPSGLDRLPEVREAILGDLAATR